MCIASERKKVRKKLNNLGHVVFIADKSRWQGVGELISCLEKKKEAPHSLNCSIATIIKKKCERRTDKNILFRNFRITSYSKNVIKPAMKRVRLVY